MPFRESSIISTLPDLTPENIGALIRAARMYQEAVWIVENSPELSWLLLTSAIETVADLWYDKGHDTVDVIDVMRASYPKLEKILRKYGQSKADELIQEVARVTFKRSLARRKFVEFIIQFLPPPPAIRPAPFAQISWELADMKKIFKKIYDYRSQALHGGKPFPAPMCMPPSPLGKEGVLEEQPHALAMRVKGSVWVAEELPIYLNTFEYIVRNAILNWWKSLVEE